LIKYMDNKFNEIEATSMPNKRTHIISDKITEKSTYIVINDEAIDNSKSEVNLKRQLRSKRTYITISDEITNNLSCNVNLEGQLLKFESAYIIINDEATNKPKSKINLEEQLERPSERAKSAVKMQDKHATKKQRLQLIEVNQSNDETKNKRKTCQNCENRNHNRATCRINKE
ncbi:6230_t:CDS:2, partial [Cetraspora pellucida]